MLLLRMFDLNFAQAVGLFSFFLGILCFYQKDDKKLKLVMLTLNSNHAFHYWLLDAHTAAFGALLSFIRTGLSIKTRSRTVAYIFILNGFGWGYYLSESWVDLFPIVGSCIGTYALFCLTGIAMRAALLTAACFWLVNNIIVGSLGGTLLEIILIMVNSTTIYRLYRGKRAGVSPASYP